VVKLEYYAAIDIGGTNIKYGVVNGQGKAVSSFKVETEAEKGGEYLVRKVTKVVASLVQGNSKIAGIGISTAGVVDYETGCIVYANENLPGYIGTNWKKTLSKHFHLPVAVCNDVHAAGAAEAWVGAGKGCRNFLCVAIGTGIGGCAFFDGRLYTGPHHRALALGYMNTAGGGGVYEKKASTAALVKKIALLTGDGDINGKNAFSRARLGNSAYADALNGWYDELAKGIANAVFCFDPERIVIGGAVCKEGQPLLDRIHDSLRKYIPEYFLSGVTLKSAECENLAGMVGAVYFLVNARRKG
jgi:predicted NBD/HSP70 family sugar kinase